MDYLSPRIKEPCMIWGAGAWGFFMYRKYVQEFYFHGFLDKNPTKEETSHDIPIYTPEILQKEHPLVLVSPKDVRLQEEIFRQLADLGYTRGRDCFSCYEVEDFIKSREYQKKEEVEQYNESEKKPIQCHFTKEENPVVIMMASNHHYADMAGVAIASIKNHRNRNRVYEIHLCHTELQQDKINLLETLSEEGFMVTCENISSHVQEISHMFRSFIHITKEGYYRLLIPTLFPNQKNVLYLDCDLVAQTDLAPLFDLDLTDCSVAIGKECRPKEYNDYIKSSMNMNFDVDFNSGVMVFHVPFWKEQHLLARCIEVAEKLDSVPPYQGKSSIYCDQNILNLVCNDSYKRFDYRWNIIDYIKFSNNISSQEEEKEAMIAACKDPWIYHYAGDIKPWEELGMKSGHYFWSVARDTVFFEELFKNLLESHLKKEAYFRRKVDEQEMKSQFLNYIKNL